MRRKVVGVMGPGSAGREVFECAEKLGKLIAENGWVLLTGGRKEGVMDAASRGAKKIGGTVVGVLPSGDAGGISEHLEIAIFTGMGSARNNINVLSSDVVVACGMGAGTASEVALALKAGRNVVLLNQEKEAVEFFGKLEPGIEVADTPEKAVEKIREFI